MIVPDSRCSLQITTLATLFTHHIPNVPVAPVKRVLISSLLLVRFVSHDRQPYSFVPPMWSRKILPIATADALNCAVTHTHTHTRGLQIRDGILVWMVDDGCSYAYVRVRVVVVEWRVYAMQWKRNTGLIRQHSDATIHSDPAGCVCACVWSMRCDKMSSETVDVADVGESRQSGEQFREYVYVAV